MRQPESLEIDADRILRDNALIANHGVKAWYAAKGQEDRERQERIRASNVDKGIQCYTPMPSGEVIRVAFKTRTGGTITREVSTAADPSGKVLARLQKRSDARWVPCR